MTEETKLAELKPCPNPWCVSHNRRDPEIFEMHKPIPMDCDIYPDKWVVACPVCPMNGPPRDTKGEAIAAWNTRPVPDDVQDMVDCLFGEADLCRNEGANDIAALLDEAAALLTSLASGRDDGWLPIEQAPFNTPVRVKAGEMTFIARLLPGASMDSDENDCDQWQAEREGEHPPCWSGGACWESNEDEVTSLQPTHFRPLPAPPTNGGK